MLSFNFSIFLHDISLTFVFSILIGFNVPNTIDLGMYTLLYAILNIGMLSKGIFVVDSLVSY